MANTDGFLYRGVKQLMSHTFLLARGAITLFTCSLADVLVCRAGNAQIKGHWRWSE